jgi:integrase
MGSVFHKTTTRPVPATAEVIRRGKARVARWKGGSKYIEAEVITTDDGRDVIRTKSRTYYAKYRDGDGQVHVVPTGCKDRSSAEQFLSRLERDADRVKANVVTTGELRRVSHQSSAIGDHVTAYIATMIGIEDHRKKTEGYIRSLASALGWSTLADMKREHLETWLAAEARKNRSARSRNGHHTALVSFCNWCVETGRLASNPFAKIRKADVDADPRRPRRALTLDEFHRLVKAAGNAKARPKGKPRSNSRRPAEKLSGPDRAELYAVLVGTGLRIGELAEILVRDVRLDSRPSSLHVEAVVDKGGKEADIPLRRDLVEMLRPRVEGRAPTAKVFDVPADLIKRFNADRKRAGIPKKDARGKSVDLHSLRMTFNTWLANAGVFPRIAQQLMRHEDIDLTMNVYTDSALFDLAAAVEALPALHQGGAALHQPLHQTGDFGVQRMSTDVNVGGDTPGDGEAS